MSFKAPKIVKEEKSKEQKREEKFDISLLIIFNVDRKILNNEFLFSKI